MLDTLKEYLLAKPNEDNWVLLEKTGGMRVNKLWEDPATGGSIALLDMPAGAGIPQRHRHASNQFMYCISGKYRYLDPAPGSHGLTLVKGSFYMNPKGSFHGPTIAEEDCLLLEIYDGPHYFELPSFHTEATVGRISNEE